MKQLVLAIVFETPSFVVVCKPGGLLVFNCENLLLYSEAGYLAPFAYAT